MKVKELIAELEKLNPEADVLCYTEDEQFIPDGHIFRLLDIETVSTSKARKRRGEDHIPTLKFGDSELAKDHILIQVLSDF